eukprot:GEMP01039944.1.p1 GENE.GEMP01039944.1~~GEMP01039944.1.p1  ORF type:complete len:547 (+),score=149.21 GEMP01039944.1:256-1896(+)
MSPSRETPVVDGIGRGFFLDIAPVETNYDAAMRTYVNAMGLQRYHRELTQFGMRCVSELDKLAEAMERYPPQLERYNASGQRISRLVVCAEWTKMHDLCAEEGLVAAGYGPGANRSFQFLKLALFSPSSGLYSCPLAMTDGCAKLLGQYPAFHSTLAALTSRDPQVFITSGQWMTERSGGSDVQDSKTVAKRLGDGSFLLSGYKWFCSAADAPIAITLAKCEGSDALSCFLIQVYKDQKLHPGIILENIKDKLGTRQLPSCEAELRDVPATLLGAPSEGVKTIATLVNVTRLYNAIMACGVMSRALAKAKAYAKSRTVFGHPLTHLELHTHTLMHMEALYRACLFMTLDAAAWLDRTEKAPEDDNAAVILRLVTPLAKAFTAKAAITIASEAIECMGGIGYMENSGMPRLLRDAQVFPVWEGTTNIQALDVQRVFSKHKGAFTIFEHGVRQKVAQSPYASRINGDVETLRSLVSQGLRVHASREFLMAMARIYAFSCLCDVAARSGAQVDKDVATFFVDTYRMGTWGIGETTIYADAAHRIVYAKL